MAHTLAVAFEEFARTIHAYTDGVPDRTFLLLSGAVLLAMGISFRKSLE